MDRAADGSHVRNTEGHQVSGPSLESFETAENNGSGPVETAYGLISSLPTTPSSTSPELMSLRGDM